MASLEPSPGCASTPARAPGPSPPGSGFREPSLRPGPRPSQPRSQASTFTSPGTPLRGPHPVTPSPPCSVWWPKPGTRHTCRKQSLPVWPAGLWREKPQQDGSPGPQLRAPPRSAPPRSSPLPPPGSTATCRPLCSLARPRRSAFFKGNPLRTGGKPKAAPERVCQDVNAQKAESPPGDRKGPMASREVQKEKLFRMVRSYKDAETSFARPTYHTPF